MNLSKSELFIHPDIYIAQSDIHGWGVFCNSDLNEYDVISEAPYITFPADDLDEDSCVHRWMHGTNEGDWDDPDTEELLLGFGFAALHNHEHGGPVNYELDFVNGLMRHFVTRYVPAGEELTLDYGYGPDWDGNG